MKDETKSNVLAKINNLVYLVVKRLFDMIVGLVGFIIIIPTSVIIKIVSMCCGDFNSIFLVQKRIGKGGKEFNLYKFRSMILNADEALIKILKENPDLAKEYKINRKLKNDPRITKIGKIIRRLSIDELPQLINVLIGDMSLIGNRPYLPREKEDMGDYFDDIVKTKPGITGYWQTSGRSNVTFQKRLELESYYSNHRSLWLDIKIFFKTFIAIFVGHGAAE